MAASQQLRETLTRDRVIGAAIALADEGGVESLSMRRLGQELGVEAMSLYNHVANKDVLLEGMVDEISSRWVLPTYEPDWKGALRRTAVSAYEEQRQHPWFPALANSRSSVGPARIRFANAALGCFREAGFSVQLAHYALHAFDGHIAGFALQNVRRVTMASLGPNIAAILRGEGVDEFPWIAESITQSTHDDDHEYLLMLDLILDGLERMRGED